jgi:hypothetical protein
VVEIVTHQALVIYGLACLGLHTRLHNRQGAWSGARAWESLLKEWNKCVVRPSVSLQSSVVVGFLLYCFWFVLVGSVLRVLLLQRRLPLPPAADPPPPDGELSCTFACSPPLLSLRTPRS